MSQFHYGSITTKYSFEILESSSLGLNSTMVRLQLEILESSSLDKEQSQFHYGSITTLHHISKFV